MSKLNLTKALPILAIVSGLILIAISFGRDRATDSNVPGTYFSRSLESGGLVRTYHVYLPSSYSEKQPTPLLFVFHGAGGSGGDMKALTSFDDIADREGFIVVYPDGYKAIWEDGSGVTAGERADTDDMGFVSAVIDKLAGEFAINLNRVYATGFSNGGMFTQRLGCEFSGKFAAIASVGGAMTEKLSSRCSPASPVPVMLIHGTEDSVVPWEGGEVRGIPEWRILSASATAEIWADINRCSSSPKVNGELSVAGKNALFRYRVYGGCKNDAGVVVYAFKGGEHTWPVGVVLQESASDKSNRVTDAEEVIWGFFEKRANK